MAKTQAYVPPHYADQDAYMADLERELAGYRNRLAELEALHVRKDDGAYLDAASGEQAVLDVLKTLKPEPKKAAAKK